MMEGPPRSPGLHVTKIIKAMEEEVFHKKYANWENAMYIGFIWEELLSLAFREYLGKRPDELELDGIAGSPDGIDFENWILEEYKCTWRSAKTPPWEIWKYMTQVKAYCKMLDTRVVKMRILYLNGYYDGKGPVYKCYLISFTQLEIEENWIMLVNYARSKGWL